MSRFSTFPNGPRGAALLLLRVSAAALITLGLDSIPLTGWVVAALLVVVIALLVGLFTRIAASICALVAAVVFFKATGALGWLAGLQALSAISLAILGAGAYSLDARLFGRRVIIRD